MGYTHYWRYPANRDRNKLRSAIDVMKATVWLYLFGMTDLKVEKSTIAIHPAVPGVIRFNGVEEEACEPFIMTLDGEGFSFCKTNQHPYDTLVVACLCVLHNFCPEFDISSDGLPYEWVDGMVLARRLTLMYWLTIPSGVMKGLHDDQHYEALFFKKLAEHGLRYDAGDRSITEVDGNKTTARHC